MMSDDFILLSENTHLLLCHTSPDTCTTLPHLKPGGVLSWTTFSQHHPPLCVPPPQREAKMVFTCLFCVLKKKNNNSELIYLTFYCHQCDIM